MLFQMIRLLVAVSSAGTPDVRQLPSFSVVVAVSGAGISATCEKGCAWESVSGEYSGGAYAISQDGIRPPASPGHATPGERTQLSGFSIIVTPAEGGVRVTCDHGCAWETLTGSSSSGMYRITESGIHLITAAAPTQTPGI